MAASPRSYRLSSAVRASAVYAIFAAAWVVLSDRLLIFAVEDKQLIGLISVWKGVLFVAVTSLALYIYLRRRPEAPPDAEPPIAGRWQLPVAAFAVFAAAIVGTGIVAHNSLERTTAAAANARLAAIGQIKIEQISGWLADEKADLKVFAHNPLVLADVRALQRRNSAAGRRRATLTAMLEEQRSTHEYRGAAIIDGSDGSVIAAAVSEGEPPNWPHRLAMPKNGDIVLMDFHRDTADTEMHVGLAIALAANPGYAPAVLVFDLDPRAGIFPKLQRWPGASDSGETLLVERVGDQVIFLNPLRFAPGAALHMARSADESGLVSAAALAGKGGSLSGHDYRKVDVLAYAGAVPDTPWLLIAKLDQAEAFADLIRLTRLTAGIVSVLLAAAALLAGFWWRGEIHRYSSERLRLQLNETKARRRFESLARMAHDGIVLIDREGLVIDANDRALALYGQTRETMLGLTVRDLCADGEGKSIGEILARLGEGNGVLFESEHRRGNGGRFPVEVSARRMESDQGWQYQAIIRDITERKHQEGRLLRLQQRYATLLQASPVGVFEADADGRGTFYNERWLQITGLSLGEAIGDGWIAAIHPDDRSRILKSWRDAMANGRGSSGEFRYRNRAGDISWVYSEVMPLRTEGRVSGFVGTITDISLRKQAEENLRASEAHFRAYFERSMIGMASTSLHRGWLEVNDRLCEILGYRREALITKTWADITHPDDRDADTAQFYRILSGEIDDYQMDRRFLRPDGSVVYTRFAVRCLRTEDGDIDHLVALVDDISERRRSEDRLRIAAQVFDGSAEGIVVTDHNNEIVMVNRAFCSITGYTQEEVVGRNPRMLSSGYHDRGFYESMWRTLHINGNWRGEIFNRRKNGDIFPEWLTISLIRDTEGQVIQHVGMFSDITERKEAAERINFLAQYDVLTGLPNRMLLRDRLGHALTQAARAEEEVAVVFLDLDRFKNINDSLGHSIGDGLLVEAAGRLQQCVRGGDTIARLGGDEFVLVLPETGAAGAISVIEKILRTLVQPYNIDNHVLRVTASLGVSFFPHDGREYDDLVKNADAAMYAAKAEGRNRYRFYTQEMNQHALEHLALETDLRSAVDQQQLVLHYQPQCRIDDGRLVGLEALVRWQHPQHGLLHPNRFIPIAEETGLILEIGAWVLRAACEQQRRWRDAGLDLVPVAVNLSAIQFRQESLVESIADLLRRYQLPARCLELELTESVLMENAEHAIHIVERLAAMGVRLCIDDFGTGYSSLMYLRRLPVRKLKIDRSFTQELGRGGSNAIVTAIIQLGRNLGIDVIAEGVETEEQREFLQRERCSEGQGYYFHRPVAAEAVEPLLRDCRVLL
jgi:diguanylate cyclase (GGDEF)-like protein/PAS domain S-box-containing protein